MDHFLARYRSDVDLAARVLHQRAFRLGIEWSRIFPRSTRGAHTLRRLDRLANHRALRRYRAILEYIRARGMTPWVTINHFTLPRWAHDPIAARDAFARTGPDDPPSVLAGALLARPLADEEKDLAMVERGRLLVGRHGEHVADLAVAGLIAVGTPGIVLADLRGRLGQCRHNSRQQYQARNR